MTSDEEEQLEQLHNRGKSLTLKCELYYIHGRKQ